MLICQCEAINDRRISDEIAAGALDVDALAERCGVGGRCGGCLPTIEALLADLGLARSQAA